MAAFRHCFGKLCELRSLAPNTPMVALTATATKLTEDETIKKVLLMQNPLDIKESPNKVNLTYSDCYKDEQRLWPQIILWVACRRHQEIKRWVWQDHNLLSHHKTVWDYLWNAKRTIKERLIHWEDKHWRKIALSRDVGHSCTSASNKKNILTSFQHEDGIIRVLVATIAFSMGVISIAKLFTGSSIMGHQRILKPLFKKLGELGMMAIRLAHFCCIMACFWIMWRETLSCLLNQLIVEEKQFWNTLTRIMRGLYWNISAVIIAPITVTAVCQTAKLPFNILCL